jgi:hypothetical protein
MLIVNDTITILMLLMIAMSLDARYNVTMFGTLGTRLARLRVKERGPTMSRPTRLEDPG